MDSITFMKTLVPDFENEGNDDYLNSKFKVYKDYVEHSEIPKSLMYEIQINPYIQSFKLKGNEEAEDLVEDIAPYLEYEFNCMFNFERYLSTDILSAYIIQQYMRKYFVSNKAIRQILYINTPLFLADKKKLIGMNSGVEMSAALSHDQYTIRAGIETASLVIWDKITEITTEYEREEFYRLLSARHKNGLSNLIYFIGDREYVGNTLGSQITNFFKGFGVTLL